MYMKEDSFMFGPQIMTGHLITSTTLLEIITDVCQPLTDVYNQYFEYLIIPFDYLIIE